jgi:hypothetical protein
MSGIVTVPDLAVLRNRGIPVKVHVLDDDGNRTFDSSGEAITAEAFVRFTNNVLADLTEPDQYGSLDGWEAAIEDNPALAIPNTLAVCWDVTRRRAGDLMLDNVLDDYATAVGGAFAMANGVPPDSVVKVLVAGIAAATTRTKMIVEGVEKEMAERDKANQTPPPSETPTESVVPPETTPTVPPEPPTPTTSVNGGVPGSDSALTLTISGV